MSTIGAMQHRVAIPGGAAWPALGLGTWRYGESTRTRAAEVSALRRAIEIGWRLFDTAEMYGSGGAESRLGEAITDAVRAGDVTRDELIVVTKVLPSNASRAGTIRACEQSLKRLRLDHVDLYLLHWPGSEPLTQTLDGFEALLAAGRIGRWGVSNFDTAQMKSLWKLDGGQACAANQVWYSLTRRGIEFELAGWQRGRGVPLMAYSPIDQGELAKAAPLRRIAERLGATPAQIALAWLMQRGDTIAIPKTANEARLRENFAAASLALDDATSRELDSLSPPPRSKQPLSMS